MSDLADPVTLDPADGTDADTALPGDDGGDRLVDQVRMLLRWAEETDTGDRADLPFEPHPRAWAMLSVGPRECPGAFRCPSGERCFAEQARSVAAEADVVVVNTHLYGAHLASGGAVLPGHDLVVFDEAHEVEGVMTASLGAEVTPGRFRALQAMARPLVKGDDEGTALGDLGEVADRLQRALESRVGTRVLHEQGNGNGGGARARNVDRARGDDQAGGAEPAGWERSFPEPTTPAVPAVAAAPTIRPEDLDLDLARLLELASSRVERLSALLRRDRHEPTAADEDDDGRQARALSAAGNLSDDLGRIASRTAGEVVWVDGTPRAPVLRLSPIDVGPPLAELLWGEVTAVLTSATIPLQLTERLGLAGFPVDKVDVGSPFDYRSHALLYVARHLPDRRRAESEPALQDELEALITAAGGRTLALFTSRRATEAAASALRDRLPYRLLVQGELPKGLLLATFAEEESSCLFATLGFWQGVDVPGRSLSLVTLDRLPFARPDDPLLEARRERAGDDAFRLVDLPRAATLLAQGTGRLIRSADDYGVVAVLDPRLATAGYRRVLLAGLPPMRRTIDRHQVEEFLGRILTDPQ
jgi:ATP-dependent DNA helicase DinG